MINRDSQNKFHSNKITKMNTASDRRLRLLSGDASYNNLLPKKSQKIFSDR